MGYITYNPNVTDDDRREMATPIHSATRTIIDTAALDNRQVVVYLRELDGDKRGKSAKVHGAQILYEIRDNPPAVADDLRHLSLATKASMV
jgi:hypothetical protein